VLLAFPVSLEVIPDEDWCRTWAVGRTIMLSRTSKIVEEVVDKMQLPPVVRLSRSFWDDSLNGTAAEKRQFVMRQLTVATARCRITHSSCRAVVCKEKIQRAFQKCWRSAQRWTLSHFDLSGNHEIMIFFLIMIAAEIKVRQC
jgi:uncharacterized protein (UPF0303 family)